MLTLLLIPVCLLSGFLGGALGFGSAVCLAPPAFILLPPAQAVVATALLSNVSNILVLSERRTKDIWWREWWVLILTAAPGLLVGAWLLHDFSRRQGELVVGVVVLLGLIIQSRFQFAREHTPSAGTGVIGAVGGVLTTSVGFSGPLVSLWLLARTRDRSQMRDTLNAYFLFTGLAAPVVLTALVGVNSALPPPWLLVVLAFAVFCGYESGKQWFHRLASEASYRRAARWLLASLAVLSLAFSLF